MAKDTPAIKVTNLSKSFRIPLDSSNGIKHKIINVFKGIKGYREFTPLKGVSFEIEKGDFFGIVGRNGSGKSTLLKTIAGIYSPDGGEISISGKLVPFIELGVGFNPELTGRENVFLNGALLGFNQEQMEVMYDDIVDFAELHDFMEERLKNYSSGMQVRLAFSIAIRAKADVLLLDEVLAVGDDAFQRKCYQYFAEVKKQGQTVVLVTHNMDAVQQFCNKAMLIDKGHKTVIGSPLEISKIYLELNSESGITTGEKSHSTTEYVSADAKVSDMDGKKIFEIAVKQKKPMEDPVFAFGIYNETGEEVYRWTSDEKMSERFDPEKHTRFRIEVLNIFPVGVFTASLFIKKRDRSKDYAIFNGIEEFEIKNKTPYVRDIRWKIPDKVIVGLEEVKNVH